MTKRIATSILVLTLLSILLQSAAHAQTTKPTVTWGKGAHGCRVGLVKFPTTMKVGDPVDVEIVVHHEGPDEAFITNITSHEYHMFKVEAALDDHDRVEPTSFAKETEYVCNGVIRGLLKDPEEMKETIRISRLIDMSRIGKYKVTIAFKFATPIDGKDVPVEVESPPFTVDVRVDK